MVSKNPKCAFTIESRNKTDWREKRVATSDVKCANSPTLSIINVIVNVGELAHLLFKTMLCKEVTRQRWHYGREIGDIKLRISALFCV